MFPLREVRNGMSNILIGGGTGFIGMPLSRLLKERGHEVHHLSRRANPKAEFPAHQWDINKMTIDQEAVDRADVIINLAGAGIADKRWTAARKKLIIDSRVKTTSLLAQSISKRPSELPHYINSSAVGFYGNRGEAICTEDMPAGDDFLSESCQAWENSVEPIREMGIPTAIVRTGIVLHPSGGALEKMLQPMALFTSGYFGNGQQWYSWIHMKDICGIYAHLIEKKLTGIYNGSAPNPARNKTLAELLPKAKGKAAVVMPVPKFGLRLALGEMADTILDSTRCSAEKIAESGYSFEQPELLAALENLLR
ncbi:MAG: TIGR01777 family oxidoreductase [Bacteroidota bacterium]